MQRDRARLFHFFTSSPGCFLVLFGFVCVAVCFLLVFVGLDCTQVFCMAFAKGQLGLLLL